MRVSAVLLAAVAATCGSPQEEDAPVTQTSEVGAAEARILYQRDLEEEAQKMRLEIAPDGAATLTVGSNRGASGIAGIGTFRSRPAPARIADLRAALAEPGFQGLPPLAVPPGEALRTFVVTPQKGEPLSRSVQFGVDPAPFVAAERIALEIVADVARHPVRAVTASVAALPAQVRRGDKIAAGLVLTNIGAEEWRVPHPSRWKRAVVGVCIRGLRSDVALADLRDHHRFELWPTGADVRLTPAPTPVQTATGAATPATVLVPPGGRLAVDVDTTLDVAPGRYTVEVTFESGLASVDGQPVLTFQYTSDGSSVDVR